VLSTLLLTAFNLAFILSLAFDALPGLPAS
jgi:hypothetical protein